NIGRYNCPVLCKFSPISQITPTLRRLTGNTNHYQSHIYQEFPGVYPYLVLSLSASIPRLATVLIMAGASPVWGMMAIIGLDSLP
ncbi:hypothetical protein, partial [Limnospira platensis]|uniref:hypothetical protein n=1 Tax=Limnospira platensis TaxID=118562 RepID=UPI003D6ECC8F